MINKVLKDCGFYKIMARVLPGRSVRSCYRFLKRCFNDRNRQGPWTANEEEMLMDMVEAKGEDWLAIGRAMGRTNDNVYDKYRHLGGGTSKRSNSRWQLREFVQLLLLVNARADQTFLDMGNAENNLGIKEEREGEKILNARESMAVKESKYNSASKVQPLMELGMKYVNGQIRRMAMDKISWTGVANKLKGRSMIDCKNKFTQLLEMVIKTHRFDDLRVVDFLEGEAVSGETEVDWLKWTEEEISGIEAKNRFTVLKKMVPAKGTKSFQELLAELRRRLLVRRGQKL